MFPINVTKNVVEEVPELLGFDSFSNDEPCDDRKAVVQRCSFRALHFVMYHLVN